MHSHILYGVDDGPKTIDHSIQMLQQAVDEGITEIIATSHRMHPLFDVNFELVTKQVQLLQHLTEQHNIPLKIYTGHEVRLSENIVSLFQNKQIHTLANSSYILLELPSSHIPNYTKNIIHSLNTIGLKPIIAHPERNHAITEKPARLERLIREGATMQLTAGSIAGHFGRAIQKLSLELVCANLVHTYGSDAHNVTTRPFLFEAGLTYLEKHKQLDAVDILLENNARIVEDKDLLLLEPEEIKRGKWWQFV